MTPSCDIVIKASGQRLQLNLLQKPQPGLKRGYPEVQQYPTVSKLERTSGNKTKCYHPEDNNEVGCLTTSHSKSLNNVLKESEKGIK